MLRKLFNILANMGVWIRLNDPRHEPVSEVGRAWGEAKENFALSLQALNPDTLSVLIKNIGAADKRASIPGWLSFYRVVIEAVGGAPVGLKSFGQAALHDPVNTAKIERTFPAGKSLASEILIAVLYDLPKGEYRISVSCAVPGGDAASVLTSNEITLRR